MVEFFQEFFDGFGVFRGEVDELHPRGVAVFLAHVLGPAHAAFGVDFLAGLQHDDETQRLAYIKGLRGKQRAAFRAQVQDAAFDGVLLGRPSVGLGVLVREAQRDVDLAVVADGAAAHAAVFLVVVRGGRGLGGGLRAGITLAVGLPAQGFSSFLLQGVSPQVGPWVEPTFCTLAGGITRDMACRDMACGRAGARLSRASAAETGNPVLSSPSLHQGISERKNSLATGSTPDVSITYCPSPFCARTYFPTASCPTAI